MAGGIEQVSVLNGEKEIPGILTRNPSHKFQRFRITLLAAQKQAERHGRVIARRAVRAAHLAQVIQPLLLVARHSHQRHRGAPRPVQ